MDLLRRAFRALAVPCIAAMLVAPTLSQDVNLRAGFATGNSAASFQVLTSGPLHESFARPVVYSGTNVVYVRSTPPALIDEVVPLQRPAGNSEWISGYWSHDDTSNNWIWVSGSWRVAPAGYAWVPGYWFQTSRGWRYVQGYWALASTADGEIDYLPAPPEPLGVTPVVTAPNADSIWVPGNWVWGGSSYDWRSGYWMGGQNDYVWTPASYSWTPYGYVYTEGYWDYALASRGLLYAPVSFVPGSYLTTGFSFSPGYAINIGLFSDSLFVRPFYSHYYYGDYYASTWWGHGYYPAFSFHMSRYGYDPLFAWAFWRHGRNNDRWLDERRARFTGLRDNPEARPPRTLDQQVRRPMAVPGASEGETAQVAVAAKDIPKANLTPLKVETAPETARADFAARTREKLQARSERIKLETGGEATAGGDVSKPHKVRMKDLMPRAAEAASAKSTVPERPALPKPEPGGRVEGRRAEAGKLPEPSIEKPPAVEMGRGRGNAGRPDAPRRPDEAPKPDAPKRPEEAPKPEAPKRPEEAPKPEAPKRPEAPKPDAGRPEPAPTPTPPARRDPPQPKPDAGKPEPQPTPTPPRRPEGVPPQPTPPRRPDAVPPTPPRRPEGIPPKPDAGKHEPQPTPTPPRRPEGVPPQPLPPRRPEGNRPQPAPPRPEGNRPPPAPPRPNNPPTPPKPDGGGKPDEKPHGNPKPKDAESRPADGAGLTQVA